MKLFVSQFGIQGKWDFGIERGLTTHWGSASA
jgi:hypothetical protein